MIMLRKIFGEREKKPRAKGGNNDKEHEWKGK